MTTPQVDLNILEKANDLLITAQTIIAEIRFVEAEKTLHKAQIIKVDISLVRAKDAIEDAQELLEQLKKKS